MGIVKFLYLASRTARMKSSRRKFIKLAGISALSSLAGAEIVYGSKLPSGLMPVILDQEDPYKTIAKDKGLTILNDRPWNVETPPHLLDDDITPADKLFIRNNGIPPAEVDISNWTLTINGESAINSRSFTIAELKKSFPNYTYQLTIECGGNGRSEFNPPAKGNQWTTGAVGCPEWTGVRLKDVLESVGINSDAVYIGYYGADTHISGDPTKVPISRGVPIAKAMQNESLIAWAMNGKDLPIMNGFPLRLVFGGWPASTSGKWLQSIAIRNVVHDGPKMGGQSYRVPCTPVSPGSTVADEDMCIIESMPVKSITSYPKSGATIQLGRRLAVRGHCWAGEYKVAKMEVSIDFGASWQACELSNPRNRFAWQHWNTVLDFPKRGYYEVWAKATDDQDNSQPMVVPGWNPRGYLNNATHRIAIKVV